MVKKMLERKLTVKNKNGDPGIEDDIELEYYILENIQDYNEMPGKKKFFHVVITKKNDENCCEEKTVKDFSNSIEETKDFVNMLADSEVTPVTLESIVEDLEYAKKNHK